MKAILVDMDGTLFFTDEVNYNAYKLAFEKYGFSFSKEQFYTTIGKSWSEFIPRITQVNDIQVHFAIHQEKKNIYKSFLGLTKLNKPLLELLILCKEKCLIALVTSASRQNTQDILNYFNLQDFFDLIITRDDVQNPKPNPECYILAMTKLNVKPTEVFIFEDSIDGVNSGIASQAFTWKLCHNESSLEYVLH